MADVAGRTEYGDISPRTAAYAAKEMLKHAEPVLVLQKFGQTKPHPRNKTKTVKFRRPIPFDAQTTPLVEGVKPDPVQMRYEDVEATLAQYGMVIEITDVIADTHEDMVQNDAIMLSGESAGATTEQITYGVVKAGTSVFRTNGTVRTSINTPITTAKQRAVTRYMKAQKGKKFTRILSGSPNYATKPVEASYPAVTHTDMENDIREMAGFVPVSEYGRQAPISDHEIGAVEDCRYVNSPDLAAFADAGGTFDGSGTEMVTTTGTSADVYPILYFAMDCFGCVPLKGKEAVTPSVINPSTKDKSDPLGQVGYVGWKTYYACLILNQSWISRLESAATAL